MASNSKKNEGRDSNPDPITGAPGSHPVSTGIGAAAAGAAGAAIGSVVPGVGTVIGGAIGAVVGAVGGGYAGKAVGEAIDPTGTDDYWRDQHKTRSYYKQGTDYSAYQPAYHYGANLAQQGHNQFDETAARKGWESSEHGKTRKFDEVRDAIRDEFDRRIQLREEKLRVSKDRVESGSVNVRKEVTSETKQVEVPVEREEVVITRHAATGRSTDKGTIGSEEIRIPVSEERVNVSKETVVTGEVEIGKRKVTDKQTVSETLRKEDVKVDTTGKTRVENRNA